MKNIPYFNHRFGLAPIIGIVSAVFVLFSSPSFANDYSTTVTIHEYYGKQGRDCHGNQLYGAKVQQGSHFYFVELYTPLSCLNQHIQEQTRVVLRRDHNGWKDVVFDGHFARIHNVTKLRGDSHSSDFYHDSPTYTDNHAHARKRPNWGPFNWW